MAGRFRRFGVLHARNYLVGFGVVRRYGLPDGRVAIVTPSGKSFSAASAVTDGKMIQSLWQHKSG